MKNLSNYGATLAEAEQHLAAFEPFHTGTFSGAWESAVYIVRSYGVILGYYSLNTNRCAIAVDAFWHSKTTSKHANLVKKAWGI